MLSYCLVPKNISLIFLTYLLKVTGSNCMSNLGESSSESRFIVVCQPQSCHPCRHQSQPWLHSRTHLIGTCTTRRLRDCIDSIHAIRRDGRISNIEIDACSMLVMLRGIGDGQQSLESVQMICKSLAQRWSTRRDRSSASSMSIQYPRLRL
jgi:hypothetical protein